MAPKSHGKSERAVLACSGACNVGQLTVEVAKRLDREGAGRFTCATSLGAHVTAKVTSVKCCEKVLVLDGCHQGCAKRVVERAGVENFAYVVISQSCCLEKNTDYDAADDDVNIEHVECLMEQCRDLLK